MLLEILSFLILGFFSGVFTGLMPGIHINLVGVLLVSLSASLLSNVNIIYLVSFIASMAISHTFLDFIPSIFLGCPNEDSGLSVLPGHELLKQGNGYEAVMLTSYGGVIAVFILILISFPLAFLFSKVYNLIHSAMLWVLLLMVFVLIFTEKKKLSALFVFLITGLLGLCVLNLDVKEPLLPLLTGLFGSSMLVMSIKNKIQIPKQEITKPKIKLFKPILSSLFSSPLCGFLPGLGSGQAAVLGSVISKPNNKEFLALLGATNVLVMGFSFVSLYAISKTRTGAAAAVQEIIGILSWKVLLLLLIVMLVSGIISFFLTKYLVKWFSNIISRINYTFLSIAVLALLVILVLIFSKPIGLLVLFASTLTGIYCNSLGVRKTQMMGCLLIPTILFYLMN